MLVGQVMGQQPQPIAIVHVATVDVERGTIATDMTVVLEAGRIKEVFKAGSKKLPSRAQVVNARGKYLIPGLWDMHVHIQDMPEPAAALYLAHGITGIRDMRMELDSLAAIRERIAQGKLLAPRLIASGPALDDVPPQWPVPVKMRIKTGAQAREAVQLLKANGVDFIKVHNFTSRDAYLAVVDEAKRLQLPFVGHVPLEISIREAVAAGQRSIEHLSEFRVVEECADDAKCQDLIGQFKRYDTWHTPTLVTLQVIAQGPGLDESRTRYIPAATKKFWNLTEAMLRGMSAEQKDLMSNRYKAALSLVAKLQRSGIGLLAGTDSPVMPGVVPGFSLHDELRLMVEAGLTPLQALQSATLNPARFLGQLNTLGTIEAGKLADLVVLDASPLDDIRNVAKIDAVITQGRLLDRAALNSLMQEAARDGGPAN